MLQKREYISKICVDEVFYMRGDPIRKKGTPSQYFDQSRALEFEHGWPSADGLAVALEWLWVLLQHHLSLRHHVTHCTRMELLQLPRSPDRHYKTMAVHA